MKLRGISYNSPVILTFAGISFCILLLNKLTGGWVNVHLFSVYRCSLKDPLAYVRFFGHVLGHADLSHYVGNMLTLLLVGPALEEKHGSRPLIWCILLTALVTGLIQFIFFPSTALLGASGIVFMMIVMSSCTCVREGEIPMTLILVLVLYLGDQVLAGLTAADSISQMGHIIGGISGAILGMRLGRKRRH